MRPDSFIIYGFFLLLCPASCLLTILIFAECEPIDITVWMERKKKSAQVQGYKDKGNFEQKKLP